MRLLANGCGWSSPPADSWSFGDRNEDTLSGMKTRFLRLIVFIGLVCILPMAGAFPSDQVKLRLPSEEVSKFRVSRASQWLVKHIVRGTLENHSELGPLTLVAWHDPSLSPNDKNALAAYAITDSLWASQSLSLQFPGHAEEIRKSLQRLNCLQNNLHEVLFQPVRTIHHRSDDDDIVHGCLMGTFRSGDKTISVRSFRMRFDADYNIGHPALFAEHAVYQSLFHYWNGELRVGEGPPEICFCFGGESSSGDLLGSRASDSRGSCHRR